MATRTAAERREQARNEYNAFFAACPSRQLLDRMSSKWVVLVLCALAGDGPGSHGDQEGMRYSELARTVAGVSQKMLTQTLRSLERDGLVTRAVMPTVPVTVTYELTDLGLSLHHVMRGVRAWAETNMDTVLAHGQDHDARTA